MNRLCDEILQLILNELDDPTSFSLITRSIHEFTRDPYVRASYFIARYGKTQALYWALGRGKLMNENTIDVLLSSGAHLSRYLVQCAIQHYYRSAVHFIKSHWVRSLNFPTLTYLLSIAGKMYGNVPVGKGEDDGAIFNVLLKESRLPADQRNVKWEVIREVVEKYKFIPFSHKDPMMAQFPLVLAIEPRLLPYARANGFHMDRKYRDFVFRKMFEKAALTSDGRTDEIVGNVRELSRLDPHMFLSRTVAAEICMEAKSNGSAYNALKTLDKAGHLRFQVSSVVQDLIKLFANTRSVTNTHSANVLRQLFADFPSKDPTVRLVLLLQIFLSEPLAHFPGIPGLPGLSLSAYVNACKEKIENMGLAPVKRTDLLEVLASKFAPDRFLGILEFGRMELNMSRNEIEGLVQEVAVRCLETGCKGRMLKKLLESYAFLDDVIRERVLKHYRLSVDDLPASEDEDACADYEAPLCRDYAKIFFPGMDIEVTQDMVQLTGQSAGDGEKRVQGERHGDQTMKDAADVDDDEDLGYIGQDTLSAMIRKDELAPSRGRRRFYDILYTTYSDTAGKLTYPAESTHIGKTVLSRYGVRSGVTAVFMMHAVINGNPLQHGGFPDMLSLENRIPVTLKHFKLLARLGRTPPASLYDDIEAGAEFYFAEDDYLPSEELSGQPVKHNKMRRHSRIRIKMVSEYTVKTESSPGPSSLPNSHHSSPSDSSTCVPSPSTGAKGRKRLRRSAATSAKSYVVPDSDDEEIADAEDEMVKHVHAHAKKRKVESNLQQWIKHLSIILKDEQKKYKEKKKRVQAATPPGTKVRVPRSDFLRSLSMNIQRLRKADQDKRQQLYGPDVPEEDYSSGEEDEYHERNVRAKRCKVGVDQ